MRPLQAIDRRKWCGCADCRRHQAHRPRIGRLLLDLETKAEVAALDEPYGFWEEYAASPPWRQLCPGCGQLDCPSWEDFDEPDEEGIEGDRV